MGLIIVVGYLLYKTKKIPDAGIRALSGVLLFGVLPCTIFQKFMQEYTPEKGKMLLISLLLSMGSLLISMLISKIFFKKNPINNFAGAFSNATFMGLPLVDAVLGPEAGMYAIFYIVCLNTLQWTYGMWLLTGDKKEVSLKTVMKNPSIIAAVVGIILFYLGLSSKLPTLVKNTVSTLSAMAAPLAMLIIGVSLAQSDLKSLYKDKNLYQVSAIRLFLVPLVILCVLWILPKEWYDLKLIIFILSAAPVGTNVASFAEAKGKDYRYAGKTVCVTTLLSIGTLPLMMAVAMAILSLGR